MASPTQAGRALWSEGEGLVRPARLAPWLAALLLAVTAILAVAGLRARPAVHEPRPAVASGGDITLYRRTIQDVARGQDYYAAATVELRRGGFPLRPFMTVRPPLLAVGLARLPDAAARGVAEE